MTVRSFLLHPLTQCASVLICTSVLALACGGTDTPPALQCNPPVVNEMYNVSFGCGTGGNITLQTSANSCSINVENGRAAQVPFTGKFIAASDGGTFSLADGDWVLDGNVRFSSYPPVDNNMFCTMVPTANGGFDATCSIENCSVVGEGEDEGSSCSADVCTMKLTPGSKNVDGGSDDDANAADAATGDSAAGTVTRTSSDASADGGS